MIRLSEDCELDSQSYELRRSGRVLKLERLPTELLLLLVEQRGELVTREQIATRIWGKDVCVDTDNSINAAVRKIRQVLKDDPERPRFIQTITGRGYRFIAPDLDPVVPQIDVDASSRQTAAAETPAVAEDTFQRVLRRIQLPKWIILPAIFTLLLAAASLYLVGSRMPVRHPAGVRRLMLAVLPFENLTGDAGQDYFSDGMTEEMISQLGTLDPQHVGVIARTSVMHYKHSHEALDEIARALGVEYVMEGSVRRDANKVRITAELIQMKDQTHLWARQYDRELKDVLVIQSEIAREISGEIQIALADHKAITPVNPAPLSPEEYEAYDLYLRGQYALSKRSITGFARAVEYFQQAIAKNPRDARAYAGLADTYALLSSYNLVSPLEAMPKARAAAQRALALDESLPEAHAALALVVQNYDWDWETAEKEYRRAIELNPNYATAHHWYAEHLAWMGRFDEAFRESAHARQLDPLSLIIAADNAAIFYFSRQYDLAAEQCRTVLAMEPGFSRASSVLVLTDMQKGSFAEALDQIQTWKSIDDGIWYYSASAEVYGLMGQRDKARQARTQLLQVYRRRPVIPITIFWTYVGTGDKDQAFAWLERAYVQHSSGITTLKVDPAFDPLRDDPRFQALLLRVGLAK
jgi:TolB-like protein/DNA-binding winged helix-turn-helix (wHTH) protein/Flp pilus assembly protein TadD